MDLWIVVTKFDALNQSIMLSNAMKSKQHVENMYNPNYSILDVMGILKFVKIENRLRLDKRSLQSRKIMYGG